MSSNVTSNKNPLAATGFKLTINSTKLANLEYFCTQCTHPSMTLPQVATPFKGYNNFVAGDAIEYAGLELRFQVSENMENYLEIYNWMRQNHANDSFEKADIILSVLNSKNNVVKKIRYIDAFPVSIGSIDFNTMNTDVEYVTCDVSFAYTYFEFLT